MRDGREDFERVQLEDVNVTVAGIGAIETVMDCRWTDL